MGGLYDRDKDRMERKILNESTSSSHRDVIEKINEVIAQEYKDLVRRVSEDTEEHKTLEIAIEKIIVDRHYSVMGKTTQELIKLVMDTLFGYGELQKYLDHEDNNGVFINGPSNVWVQMKAEVKRVDIDFGTVENLNDYLRRIVNACGATINKDEAVAVFTDNKNEIRIVMAMAPVAHISPWAVIRNHKDKSYTLDELTALGMMNQEIADFLRSLEKCNFAISGRGASGKTTNLRALLEENDETMRIMVNEDNAELRLKHPNAVQNIVKRNKKGQVYGLNILSEIGLMASIHKYVFGEIKGAEAMAFFKGAFNGNISQLTAHSDRASRLPDKLMINMRESETSLEKDDLLYMIHESLDFIIHMDRFRVVEIVEVLPYDKSKKKEDLFNTLYKFDVINSTTTFLEGSFRKVNEIISEDIKVKLKVVEKNCDSGNHTVLSSVG